MKKNRTLVLRRLSVHFFLTWMAIISVCTVPSLAQVSEVDKLASQADALFKEGRFSEATPLYQRVLTIREKALGQNHPDVARLLSNLAILYSNQARYADAEPLYKRSLAIRENLLGPNHPDVAVSLIGLAGLYVDQARYADAESMFKRALAIREKALGSDDPAVARSLSSLAGLYQTQARYADAESMFKRALTIQENDIFSNPVTVADSLNDLASLYLDQARYSDAEPMLKRSLMVRENALGQDHPDVAVPLVSLAYFYFDQGRYSEAEPLYKRALAIREKALGPDHPGVADALNSLGSLYSNQGRYGEAEPLLKRSVAIREKALGPDHPELARSLNNLAKLYRIQGRYAEAEPMFKRSLMIREQALGPNHPDVARSLTSMALLYQIQGRYADAESMFKRALAILEQVHDSLHPDVSIAHSNLAELYEIQGRYAEALPIITRIIINRQAKMGVVLPILIGAQKTNLIDQKQSFADSYNVLQFTSSSAAADAVNKLAQRYAAGTGDLATLVRRDQDFTTEYDKLDNAIISAASKPPTERNSTTEDQMRERIAAIKSERDQIQSVLNQKFPDYVALAKPQPLTLQDTQNLLADDEAVVAFNIGEKNSYAWVVTRTEGFWIEIPTTSKALNEQVQQLRQSLTFRADKLFEAALANQIYNETFAPIATKLSGKKRLSIVANGALTSIPFGLLVVSDPSGKSLKDTDWLIKSFSITVIPSIYSLKTMRAQGAASNAPKPMIAFADPVFSKASRAQARGQKIALRSLPSLYQGSQIDIKAIGEALPQLDATRKEVQTIAKDLGVGSADIKLGLDATETSVKQAKLDQYRIVYFATHGLVSGELAQFSKVKAEPALALTLPDNPTEFDDGLLQASEISQLKLNADWVVLSACNTASADSVGAEALSGLARGFLYAGARSLVVSHWDVADEATAALMSSLFDIAKVQPRLSHGEALQQATLNILSKAKTEDEAHPRFWAPFIVVGEPAKSR